MAPRGSSRLDLAEALGTVTRVFHTDSEPSLVPGMGHFLHVTPGFEVRDPAGQLLCTLVDDVTLSADLDPKAPSRDGWYRLLTDEPRLLRLLTRHADPSADVAHVLDPLATVFGTKVEAMGPAWRLNDSSGATIALAARSPGERERPCEVVTPPLVTDHQASLEALLSVARGLGFTVPVEAAVHLHVDAEPFRDVATFSNVARLFGHFREELWELLGTNPACRRLSPVPAALLELVEQPWPTWAELAAAARGTGLTKFSDVNLTKVVATDPDRHTLEIRILPGSIDAAEVVAKASLVERLLRRCQDPAPLTSWPL